MSKKINVLYYTSTSDSVGSSYILRLLSKLAVSLELRIITNKPNFFQPSHNVKIIDVNVNNIRNVLIRKYCFYIKVSLQQIKNKSDINFAFHDSAPALLFLVTKAKNIIFFHQAHDLCVRWSFSPGNLFGLLKILNKRLVCRAMKKAEKVICVSPMLANYAVSLGIRAEKLTIIPHGIEPSNYLPSFIAKNQFKVVIPEKSFIVLYAGWINENRGLSEIIDSLELISKTGKKIFYLIIGFEKQLLDEYNTILKRKGLDANSLLLGRVDAKYIPFLIDKAHICLSLLSNKMKTYRLSPPQKIMEYFALGKPVIANRIETHEYLIEDGYNGIIIDSLDSVALSEAIFKVHEDKELLKKLSVGALVSSKKYNINDQVRLIEQIIKKLMQ